MITPHCRSLTLKCRTRGCNLVSELEGLTTINAMRLRGLWPSAKGTILIAQRRNGHRTLPGDLKSAGCRRGRQASALHRAWNDMTGLAGREANSHGCTIPCSGRKARRCLVELAAQRRWQGRARDGALSAAGVRLLGPSCRRPLPDSRNFRLRCGRTMSRLDSDGARTCHARRRCRAAS